MNRCARNGYLVDATHALPIDPTDIDIDGLPVIGCSRVHCDRCRVPVRNASGFAFRTPDDVSPSALSVLYATADLTTSQLLHQTGRDWRLYFCRCSRWLEVSEHACNEPDPDPAVDPSMPWSCNGHPAIALPHDVDGVRVASLDDLRDLAMRALRGSFPPNARVTDTRHGAWLIRLHARLPPEDAAVVLEAARAALDDPDRHARGLALAFFVEVADASARARLIELLRGERSLYADVADSVTAVQVDKTLEQTAWRVLTPLVAVPGPARELARADALRGRGSRALYAALAWGDSRFTIDNLEVLAHADPDHAGDLAGSLTRLPQGSPIAELRAKIAPGAATSVRKP